MPKLRFALVRFAIVPLVSLSLTGCLREKPQLEVPVAQGDSIRFSAGSCFGTCPSYTLRVTPDGSGLLEPQKHIAVPGATRFTVTPLQYRQLRTSLASFKPPVGTEKRIGHNENCQRFATDMAEYVLEWTRADVKPTKLTFQSGCLDARYGTLRAAINRIPKTLGVDEMITAESAR